MMDHRFAYYSGQIAVLSFVLHFFYQFKLWILCNNFWDVDSMVILYFI